MGILIKVDTPSDCSRLGPKLKSLPIGGQAAVLRRHKKPLTRFKGFCGQAKTMFA